MMNRDGFKVLMTGDFNSWLGNTRGGCFTKKHPEINSNHNGMIIGSMIDILDLKIVNINEKHGEIFTRQQVDRCSNIISKSCLDLCLHEKSIPVTDFKIMKEEKDTFNSDHFMIETSIDTIPDKIAKGHKKKKTYNVKHATVTLKHTFAKLSTEHED